MLAKLEAAEICVTYFEGALKSLMQEFRTFGREKVAEDMGLKPQSTGDNSKMRLRVNFEPLALATKKLQQPELVQQLCWVVWSQSADFIYPQAGIGL